jgi:hypothetical protein
MIKNDEELLPGHDLVKRGIEELSADRVTDFSLLVLIAAPRLKRLGIRIPERTFPRPYEHQLYARLDARLGVGAHSYYNSLIRRIVSYARALEREQEP